jgi:Helicase associated domain
MKTILELGLNDVTWNRLEFAVISPDEHQSFSQSSGETFRMNESDDDSTVECWASVCSSTSSRSGGSCSDSSDSETEIDNGDNDSDSEATICASTTAKSNNGRRRLRKPLQKETTAVVPLVSNTTTVTAAAASSSSCSIAVVVNDAAWEAKFALVQEFARQHGHCRIPTTDPVLGDWVRSQRKRWRRARARLSKQQQQHDDTKLQRLQAIGFCWDGTRDYLAEKWEVNYQHLVEFHGTFGHALVPRRYPPNPVLSHWVGRQRRYYRHDKLRPDQVRRLQQVNFCWDRQGEIAAQRQERRIFALPPLCPPRPLVPNVNTHAEDPADGTTTSASSWTPTWDRHLSALRDFVAEFGHARVPRTYAPNTALGSWVRTLRQQHRRGRLSKARCDALNELGFCWNAASATTGSAAAAATATDKPQASSGDSKPPVTRLTRTATTTQRTASAVAASAPPPRRDGACQTRRRHPNDDDVDSAIAIAPAWYAQWVRLRQYHEAHGHCRVPYGYEPDPSLALWVSRMRKVLSITAVTESKSTANTATLRKKRALLDELGFCWNPRAERSDPNQRGIAAQWLERFAQLQTFHGIHGHCVVPVRGVVDRDQVSLGRWVAHQRVRWSNGNISNEEVRRLDSLGFCWGGIRGRYTGTILKTHSCSIGWNRVRV